MKKLFYILLCVWGLAQSGYSQSLYLTCPDAVTCVPNVTLAGGVIGSGTINYVPKWLQSQSLTNSLIFDDGTYVGINQPSPGARLDVLAGNNAPFFRGANSSGVLSRFQMFSGDGETYLGTIDATPLYFNTQGTPKMKITNSTGAVGIGLGTTDASAKLHVLTANNTYAAYFASASVTMGVFTGSTDAEIGTNSNHDFLLYSNGVGRINLVKTGGVEVLNSDLMIATLGKGLKIAEGANATMGVVALTAGTATVNTTKVTANSRIFIQAQNIGSGGAGAGATIYISGRVPGTSFDITSVIADDCNVAWFIIEPN